MGLVPIPGIRFDADATPRRAEGVAQSRFVVEGSAKTEDEGYSPSQQEGERELAEEETAPAEVQAASVESDSVEPDPLQGTQINCIA